MSENPKKLVLLGATGSIGENTLRVIRKHPDRLRLLAIAGKRRWEPLAQIAREFGVKHVGIFDHEALSAAKASGTFSGETIFYAGLDGLIELSKLPEADTVADAVVGTLSLKPAIAALEAGKDLALASKEILVMAGKFVTRAAKASSSSILPMDSEHNALFQCLQGGRIPEVKRLILTASGGPFRDFTLEQMHGVTLEQALKHPNWDMGPKVTIDSSTMANKGLEVIEAHWLFGLGRDQISVVVHPQSIVHSMVEYIDGSILAHLSPPIMTFAIQHALLYPDRAEGVHAPVDFTQAMSLDFRPPDYDQFPCLRLAMEAMATEGVAPAVFNASNEVAVDAFVAGKIGYMDIARVIEGTLEAIPSRDPDTLEAILEVDTEARRVASTHCQVSTC